MKSVLTQEWLDDGLGHAGRHARYSIHLSEEDRDRFAAEHAEEVQQRGREFRPIGRWAIVGVDDDTYEQLRGQQHGMWYSGEAYWDGKKYRLGSRSR